MSEGPDELRGVPDLSNGAPENLKWGRSSSEMGSQNREWGSRLRDGEAEKTREENGFWDAIDDPSRRILLPYHFIYGTRL